MIFRGGLSLAKMIHTRKFQISDELTCVYNSNLFIIWFVFYSHWVEILFKGMVFLSDRILDMEEDF